MTEKFNYTLDSVFALAPAPEMEGDRVALSQLFPPRPEIAPGVFLALQDEFCFTPGSVFADEATPMFVRNLAANVMTTVSHVERPLVDDPEVARLRGVLDRIAERLEVWYETEAGATDPLMSDLRELFEEAGMVEDGGVCRFVAND